MEHSLLYSTAMRIFVALSVGAVAFIAILNMISREIFQRFLGDLNPLVVASVVAGLGFLVILFVISKGWFAVYQRNLQGLLIALGLGTLLAIVMSVFDGFVVMPEDMNVALPHSLLFYPAIAYFVEVLFHLLPLAILLTGLTVFFPQVDPNKLIWISILMVALLEPVYQVTSFDQQIPLWATLYVGFHLFVFNMIQLSIFKQYGFVSMLTCRLAYYMVWHIIWGYLRLQLLF